MFLSYKMIVSLLFVTMIYVMLFHFYFFSLKSEYTNDNNAETLIFVVFSSFITIVTL